MRAHPASHWDGNQTGMGHMHDPRLYHNPGSSLHMGAYLGGQHFGAHPRTSWAGAQTDVGSMSDQLLGHSLKRIPPMQAHTRYAWIDFYAGMGAVPYQSLDCGH